MVYRPRIAGRTTAPRSRPVISKPKGFSYSASPPPRVPSPSRPRSTPGVRPRSTASRDEALRTSSRRPTSVRPRSPRRASSGSSSSTYRPPSGGSTGGSRGSGGTSGTSTPGAPAVDTDLEALRAARLQAALQAIAAEFGMNRGQLDAQRRGLESEYNIGIRSLDRLGEQVQTGSENMAADRGIGRSGIFAQNLAEGLGQVADQRADLTARVNPTEGAEGTQIRDIDSAIALLDQQRESAEAMARLESEQGELDLEQLIALMEAGLA